MTARSVIIADYGIGNLLSVARAIEKAGGTPEISRDPEKLAGAERLILPGVGAFGDCMRSFLECGFEEPVRHFVATGRPLLGLCVGMQIFFDRSEEFGEHRGLGLIPGEVRAIPKSDVDGHLLKTPHIGWSDLQMPAASNIPTWDEGVLRGLEPGTAMYFVHSYTAWPASSAHRYADAQYGGNLICAATRKDNITGTQFHPEKSGPAGLALMKNFVDL